MISAYTKIFTLGHKATQGLTSVNIEEKVDGSQISFKLSNNGELTIRSMRAMIDPDHPQDMFEGAVAAIKIRLPLLNLGWTYRGEVLSKPKHNTLTYGRTPKDHIAIFDIDRGIEDYLLYDAKKAEARRIGFECVPLLYGVSDKDWPKWTIERLKELFDTESFLGGCKIEGVVIKPQNYDLFGLDSKIVLAKFVSPEFKEKHEVRWASSNPSNKDIILSLGESLRTDARWHKAVQHLKESGQLQEAPQDIYELIKEVKRDILEEESEQIKNILFNHAWKSLSRMVIKGLPEWYKDQLANQHIKIELKDV